MLTSFTSFYYEKQAMGALTKGDRRAEIGSDEL